MANVDHKLQYLTVSVLLLPFILLPLQIVIIVRPNAQHHVLVRGQGKALILSPIYGLHQSNGDKSPAWYERRHVLSMVIYLAELESLAIFVSSRLLIHVSTDDDLLPLRSSLSRRREGIPGRFPLVSGLDDATHGGAGGEDGEADEDDEGLAAEKASLMFLTTLRQV